MQSTTSYHPYTYPLAFLWAFAAKCDTVLPRGVATLSGIMGKMNPSEFGHHEQLIYGQRLHVFYQLMNSDARQWDDGDVPHPAAYPVLPGYLHVIFMAEECHEDDPADAVAELVASGNSAKYLVELRNLAAGAIASVRPAASASAPAPAPTPYQQWDDFVSRGEGMSRDILVRDLNIVMATHVLMNVNANGAAAVEKLRPYINAIMRVPGFIEYLYSVQVFLPSDQPSSESASRYETGSHDLSYDE